MLSSCSHSVEGTKKGLVRNQAHLKPVWGYEVFSINSFVSIHPDASLPLLKGAYPMCLMEISTTMLASKRNIYKKEMSTRCNRLRTLWFKCKAGKFRIAWHKHSQDWHSSCQHECRNMGVMFYHSVCLYDVFSIKNYKFTEFVYLL